MLIFFWRWFFIWFMISLFDEKREVFCACFAAGLALDLFLFKSAALTGYELGRVRRVPVLLSLFFHERNSAVLKTWIVFCTVRKCMPSNLVVLSCIQLIFSFFTLWLCRPSSAVICFSVQRASCHFYCLPSKGYHDHPFFFFFFSFFPSERLG